MKIKVTNETIKSFLLDQTEDDMTDFGYLLIPNDARLNNEALCNLKKKFNQYCEDNDFEI